MRVRFRDLVPKWFRIAAFAAAVVSAMHPGVSKTQAQSHDIDDDGVLAILDELRDLRTEVQELRADIERLEALVAESPRDAHSETMDEAMVELRDAMTNRGEKRRQEIEQKIKQNNITLPDDATEEQVREYIEAILEVSQGQSSYWTKDPQVEMLMKVGTSHVDELVKAASSDGLWAEGMYLKEAIKRLANEEHRDLILQDLQAHPRLVTVVKSKGWVADAFPTLIAELRAGNGDLPPEWIEAVASLREPDLYPVLVDYLVEVDNRIAAYNAIKDIEAIDLDKAVREAWAVASKARQSDERLQMASIAVGYGHLGAMEELIRQLQLPRRLTFWPKEWIFQALQDHVAVSGNADEVIEWYQSNRDRIRFDEEARKFIAEQ